MKAKLIVFLVAVALTGITAGATRADDAERIQATVLDYIEGYFQSDADRMAQALHPNLFKCTVKQLPHDGGEILQTMTAEELIAICPINQDWVKGKTGAKSLEIVYQDPRIAVVHAVSDGFYDVISLMQLNGEWKIVQVLWDRN